MTWDRYLRESLFPSDKVSKIDSFHCNEKLQRYFPHTFGTLAELGKNTIITLVKSDF